MDFGLSRRPDREARTLKTRTHSTILNETDIILAGVDQPGNKACYSSPNSTNIAEVNFTNNQSNHNQSNTNHSINTSRNNSRSYSRHEEIVEAKIKVNEAYLTQLKSIDLKKYSFPNETKPKTDYTYANTTSYISNSKNEDCPMPNLCRRSRISPQNSNNFMNVLPTFGQSRSPDQANNYMMEKSNERLGYFSQFKSYFVYTSSQRTETTIASTSSYKTGETSIKKQPSITRPEMIYSSSTTSLKTNMNIAPFLEAEEEANRIHTKKGINSQKNKNSGCFGYFMWFILILLLLPFVLFGLKCIETNKTFEMKEFHSFLLSDIKAPLLETSDIAWKETEIFFVEAGKQISGSISDLKDALERSFKWLKADIGEIWEIYWPQLCQFANQVYTALFDQSKSFFEFIKQTLINLTNRTVNLVDKVNIKEYKSPTFRQSKESSEENKEIIKDYVLLKEKILSEAMGIVKNNLQKSDVDSMRNELDAKFNYTLSLVTNKLIDQSMQNEILKANHEKELGEMKNLMKTVLNELETRYMYSMEQLQEKIDMQSNRLEEQNKQWKNDQEQKSEDFINNPRLQEEIKTYIQSSHSDISFQKIEEYINKTFYLYNADKTGMTDFASEAVGGSILWKGGCTEDYNENSRYFTVFDIPISRLTVSPRVVIQGTVQPGNCWGFKGDKGALFIKLAARITPTSFSLEHIPKELSLTGKIDSSPQNFTIYGYEKADRTSISEETRLLLGNFRYDNMSKNTLQFFEAQTIYKDTSIRAIELKIESNNGNQEYTCLYKFRVHGKLFKTIEESKTENHETENIN